MTIALITDGMLYPIHTCLSAPEQSEGHSDPRPVVPCLPYASDPLLTPPTTPRRLLAHGPSIPATPCAATGYDPTIHPPKVPVAPEASENQGSEAPRAPLCPEGRKT